MKQGGMRLFSCFNILSLTLLTALFVYGIAGIILNTEIPGGHGPWPYNQKPIHSAHIVIFALLIPPLPLGILAILKKERTYLFWADSFLLGAFVSLLVFGAVCLRISQKEWTHELFLSLNKVRDQTKEWKWFTFVQFDLKCCGAKEYRDWRMFQSSSDPKNLTLFGDSVPISCCSREESIPKENCGQDVLKMDIEQINKLIYTQPCGPKLSQTLKANLLNVGLEMILTAFACLGVATLLYCGATELFCLADKGGFNHKSLPLAKRSVTGSVLSFRLDAFEDEEENPGRNNYDANNADTISEDGSVHNRNVRLDSKGNIKSQNIKRLQKLRTHSQARQQSQELQNNPKNKQTFGGAVEKTEMGGNDLNNNNSKARSSSGSSKRSKSGNKSKGGSNKSIGGLQKGLKAIGMNKGHNLDKNLQNGGRNGSLGFGNGGGGGGRIKWKGSSQTPRTVNSRALIRNSQKIQKNKNKTIVGSSKINFFAGGNGRKETLFNLEMLYDGIDKNISALSTTPNPSGTLNFPWSTGSNRINSNSNSNSKQPKGYPGEKPLLPIPTLSHYSSLPLFQLVRFPNGEIGTMGQYSPHFVNKNKNSTGISHPTEQSSSYNRHAYLYAPPPSVFGSYRNTEGATATSKTLSRTIMLPGGAEKVSLILLTSKNPEEEEQSISRSNVDHHHHHHQIEESNNNSNLDVGKEIEIDLGLALDLKLEIERIRIRPEEQEDLRNSLGVGVGAGEVHASPASISVISTARSSTLATIQEESESAKSSPIKGSTPILMDSPGGEGIDGTMSTLQLVDMGEGTGTDEAGANYINPIIIMDVGVVNVNESGSGTSISSSIVGMKKEDLELEDQKGIQMVELESNITSS